MKSAVFDGTPSSPDRGVCSCERRSSAFARRRIEEESLPGRGSSLRQAGRQASSMPARRAEDALVCLSLWGRACAGRLGRAGVRRGKERFEDGLVAGRI
jgi:hypothetical protein